MEKVKVTREQAEAIEAELKVTDKKRIVQHHIINIYRNEFPLSVKKIDTDSLIKALYVDYEVEPEFKVGDWISYENEYHKCIMQITGVSGDFIDVEPYHEGFKNLNRISVKSPLIRLATPEEIEKEKERRWWASHGRERYEFKNGDLIFIPYIHNLTSGFYEVNVTDRGFRWAKNESEGSVNLDEIDLSKIKVVSFSENRLDVSVDE